MAQSSDAATIAYYTVVADDRTGWTGGLLVLNSGGRPLEFQCTLPVRPSRAHEILYGPTLRDHLIGDIIGPLLVQKCRSRLSLLCCDQIEALKLASIVETPVTLVTEAAETDEGPITDDMMTGYRGVELSGAKLLVAVEQVEHVRGLAEQFENLPDAVEPFERIREAIKEAQSQIARSQSAAAA